jgi:heme/copper-type cytochrome/quinol oxidase subunit 4
MKNPTTEERYSKTFAFMIIIALILTILMQGVYYYQNMVSYTVFITILIVCSIIGTVSYIGFLYDKMFKNPGRSDIKTDMLKIVFLGVIVFFTVAFPVHIISNS